MFNALVITSTMYGSSRAVWLVVSIAEDVKVGIEVSVISLVSVLSVVKLEPLSSMVGLVFVLVGIVWTFVIREGVASMSAEWRVAVLRDPLN